MESNRILKDMMSKVNKYTRRSLAVYLSVDIQNCQPELNPQYKKSMADNLFIYLNEKNRILGFTQGYEILRKLNNDYALPADFIRNRKNLLARSTNVLMFTPEMRTFKIKREVSRSVWKEKFNNKQNLNKRLQEYKNNKYKELTHQDVLNIIQDIVLKLNQDLFTNNLVEKLKDQVSFANTTMRLLSKFMNITDDYVQSYNRLEKEKLYYIDNNIEFDERKLWEYNNTYSNRNEILTWNKIINN